jgi:putative transposase
MRRSQHDRIGWHVIARGARRLELFHDQDDFPQFLTFLKYSLAQSNAVLWAYALMSNHYHLVLYASSEELRGCVQRLNRLYSSYHNHKYSLVGHAFDGPYRAYPQSSPLLLLRCIAYVFMNPVKAFLVKDPKDYPWSCYKQYLGIPGSPMEADLRSLIAMADPDPKQAWFYFHRAMDREARRPKRNVSDGLTMTALHAQQFEWLLEIAEDRHEELAGEAPELVAIYWARQLGVTPRAIANVLGKSSRVISDLLYQLKKRLESDPNLKVILTPP